MRALVSSLVLGSLALSAGCADKTGILVEVTSSDLSIPGDVDALRFVVVSDTGRRVDETFPLDGTWPHGLAVLPAGAGDSRVVVTVIGERGGQPRVRRVVEARFERGTSRRVVVALSRDCLDLACPEGVDCVSGMCVGVMMPDGGIDGGGGMDAGAMDGGAMDGGAGDGGLRDGGAGDGGPRDGGPRDGGPGDGGPGDGGPPEAGGPLDAGRDSGLDAGAAHDAGADAGPMARPLYFSEYVEGSSNNKALEIYNASGAPVELTGCSVRTYFNGNVAFTAAALSATIPARGTHVICHASSAPALLALCQQTVSAGAMNFNGDDAIVLHCDGMDLDSIGQAGVQPAGGGWGSGTTSTMNATLRRSCAVTTGRTNRTDPFDPALEWTGHPVDTFSGLGSRGCP